MKVGNPSYYFLISLQVIVAILSIVYLVYLTVFAFFNPDKPAWLGTVKDERTIFGSYEEVKDKEAVRVIDIHSRFTSWFTWGFINWFWPPLIIAVSWICYKINSCCGIFSVIIMGCWGSCSILTWLILGIAWRFSYDG